MQFQDSRIAVVSISKSKICFISSLICFNKLTKYIIIGKEQTRNAIAFRIQSAE